MAITTKDTGADDRSNHRLPDGTEQLLLDSIIPYQINRLSHRMNRLLDQELRSQGLSISNWRIMAVLDFNSSVSVNELADYAMIEQSTLSRMLQRMEASDLIEVQRASHDGRMRTIHLTPHGRERYEAVRDITLRHVSRIIDGFSRADRALVSQFIRRMQDNIENLPLT